jgi:hypothetical protein
MIYKWFYLLVILLLFLLTLLCFFIVLLLKKVGESLCGSFIWLILNLLLAFKGAGFLIIPVCWTIPIWLLYRYSKVNTALNLIFSIPALLLLVPFIQMFPIGLGLKVLFGSALLTVLTFGYYSSYLVFHKKWLWSVLLLLISIGFC